MSGRAGPGLGLVAIVVVVAAIVAGLFVLGSPTDERARRSDERRVRDLQGIRSATDVYFTRHGALPESLADLGGEPGLAVSTNDPATGEAYEYRAVDTIRYEVCATFERETEAITGRAQQDVFAHASGRQCFELEADEVAAIDRR